MLLELYGLCSGDKRSFEFSEVFRGDLIVVSSMASALLYAVLLA